MRRRGRLVDPLARAKARAGRRYERARRAAALAAGVRLAASGRRVLRRAVPDQRLDPPPPLRAGGRELDVVEDLSAYTGLPRATVLALLRRELDDFRREWHVTPEELREDRWYYLSSSMYLFANAVHLHESPELVTSLARHVPEGGRALDFGGGTGNLALGLAALGLRADHIELSALQKDFVRFRVHKHGLGDRVRVLDSWEAPPEAAYDLVCALDVLEHVPDLARLLDESLLPALKPGGILAEQSPFGADAWNPMHHADTGLDAALRRHGLEPAGSEDGVRLWRAPAG